MKTNNKIIAMLLVASMLSFGIVIADDVEADAAENEVTVSSFTDLATYLSDSTTTKVTLASNGIFNGSSRIDVTTSKILDLNGQTITMSCKSFVQVTNDATLTIDGSVDGSAINGTLMAGKSSDDNGNLVITGGTYTATIADEFEVQSNGTCTNSSVTATGATFNSTDVTFYIAGSGTWTITNCVINGYTGIYMKAGTLILDNTSVYATGPAADPLPNGNGASSTGDALIIDAKHDYYGNVSVLIRGNSVLDSANRNSICETYTDYPTTVAHSITITEGTFDNDSSFKSISYSSFFESALQSGASEASITGGVYKTSPAALVTDPEYTVKEISGMFYVGEVGSDDDTIITEETETAEDGTKVTTEAVISVDSTGKVSGATVNIETSTGSKATARINSSGSTTLVSDTKEDIQLSDMALETIINLSRSASGSDSVSLNVTTSGTSVSLGANATGAVADGSLNLSLTMNRGTSAQTTITLNSESLDSGSTYTLSVASNSKKASILTNAGLTGLTPFDLGLYVNDEETELSGPVTVSIPVQEKYDNMRLYCLDEKKFYSASYRNGSVTASLPHFSTWAIVYDKPVVVTEDDDDILFILEQQRKAQEAASAQTTSGDDSGEEAAIIIAAAAVAGAMLACAFFAFRRP